MLARYLKIFCGCHCLPERSFFYKGKQFPVCARCTGILSGYLLGILWIIVFGHWDIGICLLACLPVMIDGIGQHYGKWVSNNPRRLITGVLLGMAIISLLANYRLLIIWEAKKIVQFFHIV